MQSYQHHTGDHIVCASMRAITLLLQMGQGLQPDSMEQNRYSPRRMAPAQTGHYCHSLCISLATVLQRHRQSLPLMLA